MKIHILFFNSILFITNEAYAYQIKSITDLCSTSDSLLKSFQSRVLNHMKEIHLGENENSAALVRYTWNSSNFKKMDECKFRVIAQPDEKYKNRGVFVSIRRLNLRKSPGSGECIDYIRLTFGQEKSPKFCGQLNASVDDVEKIYFGEGGGMIMVYLKLDRYKPLKNIEDSLDIELVFTANQDCGSENMTRCYENTCISNQFDNDHINNCPPPFCSDESGRCPKPPQVVETKEQTNNTDIVISALTSLIFTLVGVGSCLWLCWHIKDCFLPESESQTNRSISNANSNSRRTNNTLSTAFNTPGDSDTSASSSNYRPAAPQTTTTTTADKDDPPAYDELFPHLAKTNNETNK